MRTIVQLSPIVISKIAAGEVIERPSYALKELLENALDAKATDIKIHLEDAGLTTLQVMDNGIGMSPEDVTESWKSHTTSKLEHADDLHHIHTFGFRGEALSSLGAICTLTIQSRQSHSPTGYSIVIDNGKLVREHQIGMFEGTMITAKGLFDSVPARKKFLKSTRMELRQCVLMVQQFAMAYPSVGFTLTHGKKLLLSFPKTTDQGERIEQVLGRETYAQTIPVDNQTSYLRVTGYIAKPQMHARTKQKQYIFINNRNITDTIISTAVKDAYGTMLESATYPIFVLFITLPVELVDINIHPRKENIRFGDSAFVSRTMKHIIQEVLSANNISYEQLSWKKTGAGLAQSFAGTLLRETVLDHEQYRTKDISTITQFQNLYIIATSKQTIRIYDQHAAHERVIFEKLKKEFLLQQSKRKQYVLPKPFLLTLPPHDALLLQEHADLIREMGFSFITDSITHVPYLFQDRNPKELILDILSKLESTQRTQEIDTVSEEMLAFLACRAAVKAGDPLTQEQMRNILKDLETTPNNATCPHGRPTSITVHINELNGLFKRS